MEQFSVRWSGKEKAPRMTGPGWIIEEASMLRKPRGTPPRSGRREETLSADRKDPAIAGESPHVACYEENPKESIFVVVDVRRPSSAIGKIPP